MAKLIYCSDCGVKVGELAAGTLIKRKVSFYCDRCHTKVQALQMMKNNNSPNQTGDINDFFGGIFK